MAIFRTKLLKIDPCVSSVVAVQCNLFYRRRKCLTILVRSLWNGWIFQISSRNLNYYFDFEICPSLCLSFCQSFFLSDLYKMDQSWSNWISHQSKNVAKKNLSHLQRGQKWLFYFGSDLSKMDQSWSNWISHQTNIVTIESYQIYIKDKKGCVSLFFGSDLSKMNQTWSNLIKFVQNWFSPIKNCYYKKLSHLKKG